MKQSFLCAACLIFTMTSAFAAEDVQPDISQNETSADVAVGTSQIVEQKKSLRFLLGVGETAGGDKLVIATYTDGSTDSISAGDGLAFYGGIGYHLNDAVSLQGTIGYHSESTKSASNGDVTFSRWPLELLAFYHVKEAFKIGGGIRLNKSPKVKGSGIASNINESFDSTIGLVIEGEYLFSSKVGVKVRRVSEKYKQSGSPVSVDGSHFGVLASFYF